jgi:hypothetical protein
MLTLVRGRMANSASETKDMEQLRFQVHYIDAFAHVY